MSNSRNTETALRDIVKNLKGLHKIVMSVMIDTAAIRATLLVKSRDRRVYNQRVRAAGKLAKSLLEKALLSCDDIMCSQAATPTGTTVEFPTEKRAHVH